MANKKKMTQDVFDGILEQRLGLVKSTMLAKGKEYRRNENPFHNFEAGAKLTNQNREDVLKGFLLKHEISINDMLEDWRNGITPARHTVAEKFGDVINYFMILEAMMIDDIDKSSDLPF